MKTLVVGFSVSVLLLQTALFCHAVEALALRKQSFDQDPGWEGRNNRIVPTKPLAVKQDFGYSTTNFAGKAPGEVGGTIQRSTTPASYAAQFAPKTLEDKLSASGTFAITRATPG